MIGTRKQNAVGESMADASRLSLPNLGTAIRWLLEHGVKSSRLASVLRTNPKYIRVLRHRAHSLQFNAPADSLDALHKRPRSGMKKRLGVRPHEDAVVYSANAAKRISDLEQEIDSVYEIHGRSGDFFIGLDQLSSYDSLPGYPSSAKWLRFMARLRQHRAWFYTHSGMSTSAFQEAKLAMDLSDLAYRESDDPLDLRRLREASLIASHACLLVADPTTCLRLLNLARAASEKISESLGSEYFRQLGTAHFQLLGPEDDVGELRSYFKQATDAMESKQECRNQGQLQMMGARHMALLGTPDMDSANSILDQVRRDFAPSSLEYAMMLNWTAACALATDSSDMHTYALGLLRESLVRSEAYGHQATRARLLALTTEVGLERPYWKSWIYRALYENAFRTS